MDTFSAAQQRLALACRLSGLTPTGLAKAAGLSSSTITRVLSDQTRNTPTTKTMAKVDEAVRKAVRAAHQPEQAAKILNEWDSHATLGTQSVDIDPTLMREVILGVLHSVRNVRDSIPDNVLADMIIGGYREFAAKRAADCETES